MRRVLGYLALAAAVALAAAWLANQQGALAFELDGWRINMSAGLALALAILFAVVAILLARMANTIVSGPGALTAWWRSRRQRRGEDALARGLIAAAAGDLATLRDAIKAAHALYGYTPLGRLLSAQAAAMLGDDAAQCAAYRAMLDQADTAFLGLRGLFLAAQARGDHADAIDWATRAHALKPQADWPVQALFALYCTAAQWDAAKAMVDAAAKAKLIPAAIAKRRLAVLLTAQALEAEAGAPTHALDLARAALELAPGLPAAAALAARRLADDGKVERARAIVEAAWMQFPHPDLAVVYGAISPRDTAPERANRLLALAQRNGDRFESCLLAAEQYVVLERWADARRLLAPLLQGAPSTRVCILMAEIEQAQHQNSVAGQDWLKRAIYAPRDNQWRCDQCGWASPQWQALCQPCHSFDSLRWMGQEAIDGTDRPTAAH